jgi:hypothetical protein
VTDQHPHPEQPDFHAYAVGPVYASVCTCLSDADATDWLNELFPTGLSSRWHISDSATFPNGEPNPSPCNDSPHTNHRHVLFNC